MKARALLSAALALALAAPVALARPGEWRGNGANRPHNHMYTQNRQPVFMAQRQMPPPGRGGGMNPDERQRLRDDMRWANREPQRDDSPRRAEPGRWSPEDREKLRRDIQDANRDMPRQPPRDGGRGGWRR